MLLYRYAQGWGYREKVLETKGLIAHLVILTKNFIDFSDLSIFAIISENDHCLGKVWKYYYINKNECKLSLLWALHLPSTVQFTAEQNWGLHLGSKLLFLFISACLFLSLILLFPSFRLSLSWEFLCAHTHSLSLHFSRYRGNAVNESSSPFSSMSAKVITKTTHSHLPNLCHISSLQLYWLTDDVFVCHSLWPASVQPCYCICVIYLHCYINKIIKFISNIIV